jgi:hypothetical protein
LFEIGESEVVYTALHEFLSYNSELSKLDTVSYRDMHPVVAKTGVISLPESQIPEGAVGYR